MRALVRLAAVMGMAACGGGHGKAAVVAPPGAGAGAGAGAGTGAGEAPKTAYRATIRWTSYGIPHIVAADVGGVAFGQGYAQAKAHLCELADSFVRVRGERARYLGAGPDDAYVASDLANLHLGYHRRAEEALRKASPEARAMLDGYAAGYDLYLTRTPAAERPAACRDGAWVQPITAIDVAAYGLSVSSLASVHFLEGAIAHAQPGGGGQASLAVPRGGASNGWAIGGDRTASGGGILVANPHFPWEGELLFHEAQLTVPGQLDVYGAGLLGVPGIVIGMTGDHAWTHTFSASTHMVVYRLDLADTDAHHYLRAGATRPLVPTTYQVQVAGAGGALATRSATLWRSDVGPMIATDATPWDGPGGHAFTVRDVGGSDLVALDEYLAMARAKDRDAFERALALHGTPFVNTIYADAGGDALYVDGSRVPAFTDEGLGGWKLARKLVPAVEAAWRNRLVVVDGSNPLFDLVDDDPAAPGALAIAQAPRILRRDFVMNANDSYRFTNPAAPETREEHSPLYGDDDGHPSTRTLMNLAMLRADDPASGPDHRFTLDEAAAAMLSNRSFTAERLQDDVAAACTSLRKLPRGPLPAGCAELAAWDGRFDAASTGAALWRELVAGLAPDGSVPWARAYDPAAPRLTPDGLTADTATIGRALAQAVAALDA
ncbi:MAG TPA: penicillin acylase family protein, partial [Kofleriaceae bacterium]|nr:penicillin acylase family protein [Kofleriaceae bacterium]